MSLNPEPQIAGQSGVVRTVKCPECFKPLGADDYYGHDCEV